MSTPTNKSIVSRAFNNPRLQGFLMLFVLVLAAGLSVAQQFRRTGAEMEVPVVAPEPGEDVYLVARLWEWYPIIEFEKGKQYKVHMTSIDYNHGFSLQPTNINIQIVPGYEHVNKITPTESGTFGIICNEFCGIGHHKMVGRIYVK